MQVVQAPKPFLKWAGGKSQLISQYTNLFPERFSTYFEPFLGGGAVFFHLSPSKAVLSDANSELINVYLAVRDEVDGVVKRLARRKNETTHYYRARAQNPRRLSTLNRASRFIFLNKTCYNGLYRVNQRGQFNVPFGRYKKPNICDKDNLQSASGALAGATLLVGDFENMVELAGKDDFVYLDPPYHPLTLTSNFTGYVRDGFSEDGQIRLAKVVADLNLRGCLVMISNSDTPLVRELYSGYEMLTVQARRAINSKGDRRGAINELVIRNYG